MSTIYKAQIEFIATEDSYEQGYLEQVNSWDETITDYTVDGLKQKILEATYTKDWSLVDDDQYNEYDWCTEYHASYMANADNVGDASDSEMEQWRKGEIEILYAIDCRILVTKVTEEKVSL